MKNNFMISIDLDLICSSKVHLLCDNLNLKFILFYFILFYFIYHHNYFISSPGIISIDLELCCRGPQTERGPSTISHGYISSLHSSTV